MDRKNIKFQSQKVVYPKKLYMMTMWFYLKKGKKMVAPLRQVFPEAETALAESRQIYQKRIKTMNLIEWAMITPLVYLEKLNLKKEYWDNPAFEYKELDRTNQFLSAFVNYKDYKLMITPHDVKEKIFTAPMPFIKNSSMRDIEAFMLTSDWHVDPTSDSIAFYEFQNSVGINIFTGKTHKENVDEDIGEFTN